MGQAMRKQGNVGGDVVAFVIQRGLGAVDWRSVHKGRDVAATDDRARLEYHLGLRDRVRALVQADAQKRGVLQ